MIKLGISVEMEDSEEIIDCVMGQGRYKSLTNKNHNKKGKEKFAFR